MTSDDEIRYFGTEEPVRPGDRVKMKRWWRFVDGVVAHVPGISKFRKEFDGYDVREVAIRTHDGMLYGVVVDPDDNRLRKTVVFQVRGTEPEAIPDVIDDPYIDNE